MTAHEAYAAAVESLSPSERLRLARLILDGLTEPAARALEYSDEWSAEDMHDIAEFSLKSAVGLDGGE